MEQKTFEFMIEVDKSIAYLYSLDYSVNFQSIQKIEEKREIFDN